MRLRPLFAGAALSLCVPTLSAAVVPSGFVDQVQVSGLQDPVGFAFLPDGRILIVEQTTAAIRLAVNGVPTTLATVPGVATGGEQGLLGIAVDPRWPTKPHVYVHYTNDNFPSKIHISRFTLTGDLDYTGTGMLTLDPASRYDLLTDIDNNATNHNGGTVRFGTDGMLYVSLGEDADACAAQDSTNLNGKILRLGVSQLPDGPGGPPNKVLLVPPGNPFAAHSNANARLVWAMGLRNPFRFHVDPATGHLFVADVGQTQWEEIDHVDAGGLNFGWPWREGPDPLGMCGEGPTSGFVQPIHTFGHDVMAAIISAGLYRRNGGALQFPESYEGAYLCSDYYFGALYVLQNSGGTWSIMPPVPGQPPGPAWATGLESVADFAIGLDGALWYCRQGADDLRRIAYVGPTAVDPAPVRIIPEDRAYYDLQGRRVDNPTQNGLYFTRAGRRKVVLR